LAWDLLLHQSVVVKEVLTDQLPQLEREFGVLQKLRHPNLVQALDLVTEQQDQVYLVQTHAPGLDFASWARRDRSPGRICEGAGAVLRGLTFLHHRGAVHRDIKPDNVRVADARIGALPGARLVDFGLATFSPAPGTAGTPGYLAPEVLAGEPATAASDLFSFGAMLLEALTDEPGGYLLDGRRAAEPDHAVKSHGGLGELAAALLHDDPRQRPAGAVLLDALGEIAGRTLKISLEELRGDYFPRPPLVGRDDEGKQVELLLEQAAAGACFLLRLEGVGRRTFADEMAARARLHGLQVIDAHTGAALASALAPEDHGAGALDRQASRLVDRLAAWPRPLMLNSQVPREGADRLLEAVLDQLTRLERGKGLRGLLVMTTAPVATWPRLRLPELTAAQVERLVQGLLHHLEQIPWLDQVHQATGGDPALVVELVRAQIEAGLPRQLVTAPLSSSTDGARVEALEPQQRQLLASISLAPAPVPPEVLASVAGDAMDQLEALLTRGLLAISGSGVAAANRAVAAAAGAQLDEPRQRALHLRFAEAWAARSSRGEQPDAAVLGHHLLHGGKAGEAAPHLLQSTSVEDMEQAAQRLPAGAPHRLALVSRLARLARAEGDLDRGLELVKQLDHGFPADAVLLRAELLLDAGHPARALEALEASEPADSGAAIDRTLLMEARAHILLGANEAAGDAATAGLALEGVPAERRAELQNVAGLAALQGGQAEQSLYLLRQAEETARDLAQPELLARVLNSRGMANQRLGRPEQAARDYGESLRLFRQLGDLRLAASCALNLGTLAHRQVDYEAALAQYRAASDLGQRYPLGHTTLWALANEANLLLVFGEVEAAEQRLERASRAGGAQAGGRSLSGHILVYRADAARARGRMEQARGLLERAQERFEPNDDPGLEAAALLGCELDLLEGRAEEAAAHSARLLAGMAPNAPDRHVACLIAGRAALALEQDDEAHQRLEQALSLARREGALERLWEIEAALSELWRHRGDRGRRRQHERACAEAVARLHEQVPPQHRPAFQRRPDLQLPFLAEAGEARTPAPDDRLLRLLQINKELNRGLPLDRLLVQILDSAVELTGAERGLVLLLRRGRLRLAAARNADREPLRRGAAKYSQTIARQVAGDGRPAVLSDAQADQRLGARQSISDMRLRAVLCVPLRARDEVRGVLYLDNRFAPGLFDEQTVALAEAFADQACIAMENARLLEEATRRGAELADARAAMEALNHRLSAQVARQSQQLSEIQVRLAHQEEELARRYNAANIIGRSKPMLELFSTMDRVADAEVPVVIHGESGTGKELVARAIHQASPRAAEPFVAVNCGALPTDLLESELFGYARGAFTGATRDRAGLFEAAGGGTLLLDEVGDMEQEMQVKLLRVLQERTFRRLGEQQERRSLCRVLAASHRRLDRLVETGRFREDLYYRLKVVQLEVPALRQRREDIPLLVEFFLADEQARPSLGPAALRALVDYHWPGNVRQLHNELQRAALLAGDTIELADLSRQVRGAAVPGQDEPAAPGLRQALQQHERALIEAALQTTDRNVTAAAGRLGLHRVALHRRMRALGITGARARAKRSGP